MQAKVIHFQMPTDAELLVAYGRVTIAHAQLDHMLQMTVKTVANIEVKEALLGTRSMGSTELRQRVRKLAHQRLGEGKSMVLMDAILQEANNATRDRNSFIHDPLAKDENGKWLATGSDAHTKDAPTAAQLNELAERITDIVLRLNHARLVGWLSLACLNKPMA